MELAMTAADRKRLASLLGRLGSSYAGERDNAAEAVEKFRIRHNFTWDEILGQSMAPPVVDRTPPPSPPPPPHPWTPPPPPPHPWTPPPPSPTRHFTASLIRESMPWVFAAIFQIAIVWGGIISFGYLVAR